MLASYSITFISYVYAIGTRIWAVSRIMLSFDKILGDLGLYIMHSNILTTDYQLRPDIQIQPCHGRAQILWPTLAVTDEWLTGTDTLVLQNFEQVPYIYTRIN